jgi:hypothetical protein
VKKKKKMIRVVEQKKNVAVAAAGFFKNLKIYLVKNVVSKREGDF